MATKDVFRIYDGNLALTLFKQFSHMSESPIPQIYNNLYASELHIMKKKKNKANCPSPLCYYLPFPIIAIVQIGYSCKY